METHASAELLKIVKESSGFDGEVTHAMTFDELGLDSLDFICMIQEIREKVGPISDLEASHCGTVGDLVSHFCA